MNGRPARENKRIAYPDPRPETKSKNAAITFFKAFFVVLALVWLSSPAPANAEIREGPLTQADIDAYIFLAPRFFGEITNYPDQAAKLLNEVKLTRRRAIYIAAKIPLTQALARGLISPGQLLGIPAYLHPTTEEVRLVNANLMTLMQAESAAIDSAGVKVPRKWREVPRK